MSQVPPIQEFKQSSTPRRSTPAPRPTPIMRPSRPSTQNAAKATVGIVLVITGLAITCYGFYWQWAVFSQVIGETDDAKLAGAGLAMQIVSVTNWIIIGTGVITAALGAKTIVE